MIILSGPDTESFVDRLNANSFASEGYRGEFFLFEEFVPTESGKGAAGVVMGR